MQVSELIEELEGILAGHGDIRVFIEYDGTDYPYGVNRHISVEDVDGETGVVL